MEHSQSIRTTIIDAVDDYTSNGVDQEPMIWLQDYLGRKLPDKSVDAIHAISGEILETLDLMEQKKAEMTAAKAAGQSAEQWLVSDIMQEESSNGDKARKAAQFLNGIVRSKAEFENAENVEIIDTEDDTEWRDEKWNDYCLKDTLKNVAKGAGQAGLREIAADGLVKASDEGVRAAVTDKEFIADTLIDGVSVGLKCAVSAGLVIAEQTGIIPVTPIKVLATIAHKTVESAAVFKDVIKKKCTVTEALVHIKDTAVSTISGLWAQHKDQIRSEIVEAVGTVFGVQGAVVAGAVNGLLTEKSEEPRLLTVLKEAGKAAARFFTKEIKLPFFNKTKAIQLNMNES